MSAEQELIDACKTAYETGGYVAALDFADEAGSAILCPGCAGHKIKNKRLCIVCLGDCFVGPTEAVENALRALSSNK